MQQNEIHLIQQVLKGNTNAFKTLVDKYQNYVFTICMRVLKNREEAEEAAQDTFVKVFKTLRSYQQQAKFSTWLYTVTYRTAIDKSRLKKQDTQSIDAAEDFLQIVDKLSPSPAHQVQEKDLKEVLEKIIQQLPPIEANLITLFYLHEKTVSEISAITQLSKSNIKVKLFRLRAVLRKKLSHYLQSEIGQLLS